MGHSMINPQLPRYTPKGGVFGSGPLDLLGSFFMTEALKEPGGVDALVRGMVRQASQEVDMQVVDDLRNFLFGAGSGGLDLAAVNIQRGRDHGLASYNAYRVAYGLPSISNFAEAVSEPQAVADLQSLYGVPDNADLWVAGLAETHVPGSSFGPTFQAIIADQFTRLRDGDRFWYENVYDAGTIAQLNATRLSDVIERNTTVGNLPPSVFHVSVDFNEDSTLNLDDLSYFVQAYQGQNLRADLNGDGLLNLDDINIFVDAFLSVWY
ncbi:MAG: peroxidase family protein [Phycisphaerales bacterium]